MALSFVTLLILKILKETRFILSYIRKSIATDIERRGRKGGRVGRGSEWGEKKEKRKGERQEKGERERSTDSVGRGENREKRLDRDTRGERE